MGRSTCLQKSQHTRSHTCSRSLRSCLILSLLEIDTQFGTGSIQLSCSGSSKSSHQSSINMCSHKSACRCLGSLQVDKSKRTVYLKWSITMDIGRGIDKLNWLAIFRMGSSACQRAPRTSSTGSSCWHLWGCSMSKLCWPHKTDSLWKQCCQYSKADKWCSCCSCWRSYSLSWSQAELDSLSCTRPVDNYFE